MTAVTKARRAVAAEPAGAPTATEMIERWFRNLDFRAKLAVAASHILVDADNPLESQMREIIGEFEEEILAEAGKPTGKAQGPDVAMVGVLVNLKAGEENG